MKVTVWNEYRHEKSEEHIRKVYPEGIHTQIASFLKENGFDVTTATLDEPEHGLTAEVLENTDVLIWWGHMAHGEVKDEIVERVCKRVNRKGMGLVVLHSGHHSKVFKKLMGTSCSLMWREIGEHGRVWCVDPTHPIAQGVPQSFVLEKEECYCERFQIPTPDELVYVTWWEGGEIFRGGVTYKRGYGKIFYFHPGHETVPSYYNENVIKVIGNGIRWAKPIAEIPDEPVDPVDPEIPDEPVDPVDPITPDEPDEPVVPDEPFVPQQPDEPVSPGTSDISYVYGVMAMIAALAAIGVFTSKKVVK